MKICFSDDSAEQGYTAIRLFDFLAREIHCPQTRRKEFRVVRKRMSEHIPEALLTYFHSVSEFLTINSLADTFTSLLDYGTKNDYVMRDENENYLAS